MQQAGCNHDNSLAQQINSNIQQQLNQRDSHMLEMIQHVPSLAE